MNPNWANLVLLIAQLTPAIVQMIEAIAAAAPGAQKKQAAQAAIAAATGNPSAGSLAAPVIDAAVAAKNATGEFSHKPAQQIG